MTSNGASGTVSTDYRSGDGVAIRSAPIEDAAQQAAYQPWVEIECVQLSGGQQVAQLDSLDFVSQQIVRERQDASVQKLGATPADYCTVSICTQRPATRVSEHAGGQTDAIFFLPANTEFDILIPSGGETAYIGFSQEEFLKGARVLNPEFWERPPQGIVPLTTQRQKEFKDIADLWLNAALATTCSGGTTDTSGLRSHLLHSVLQVAAVSDDGPAPSINDRSRAFKIGRMARAFVEDCAESDELPTIVDICEALGVSERTLQYAFREYVGMSPIAYLRICRLNRVRAELAASDPKETTITQVAMRFGFLHLGRFAGDYKRMFGETPSQTLAS